MFETKLLTAKKQSAYILCSLLGEMKQCYVMGHGCSSPPIAKLNGFHAWTWFYEFTTAGVCTPSAEHSQVAKSAKWPYALQVGQLIEQRV